MAKKLNDLRRPRPATTAPAAGGITGQLPLPERGRQFFTPFEQAMLAKLGYKPGDPLPSNLAEQIAAATAEAQADMDTTRTPVPLDTPPLVVKPGIDIDSLPEDKQRELRESLRLAKDQQAFYEQARKAGLAQAGPGVNEAIVASMSPQMQRTGAEAPGAFAIEDDISIGKAAPTSQASQPSPQPAPQPTPQPEAASQAGEDAKPALCPHCGWDLSLHDDLEVTDEDKTNYLIATLGMKRFRKRVDLLGGRLSVVFRALTSYESDLAYRQLVLDGKRDAVGDFVSPTDTHWRNLMTYRLVMAIESVTSRENGTVEIDELANIQVDEESCPAPNTKLYAVLPAVISAVMPTDSIRRVIGVAHHRFGLTLEKMEAMADQPNFWQAIGERA